MSKQQDGIKIANNKVIVHLEQEKKKNGNLRVQVSALKLQYLWWSPFGKKSTMEDQNLPNTEWVGEHCHVSVLTWKNKGKQNIFLVYEDREVV